MKKLIISLAVLVIVGFGVYYLVFNNGSSGTPTISPTATNSIDTSSPKPTTQLPSVTPTPSSTTTPKASVSKTPMPSSTSVSISNFSFVPSALVIKKGTKVTWINNDSVPHTVISDSGNLLSSPTLAPGQSFSFAFPIAVVINYHCSIHPTMKGSVTVTN